MRKFPLYRQIEQMDCGPTCLKMVAKYYGKSYSIQSLRDKSFMTLNGVSMLYISQTAEAIGFKTLAVEINFEQLAQKALLPCILYWRQNHFGASSSKTKFSKKIWVADPAFGKIALDRNVFLKNWVNTTSQKGVALFFLSRALIFSRWKSRKRN